MPYMKEPVVVPLTLQLTYDADEGLFHIEIIDVEELVFVARYNEKYEAMKYGYVLQSITEIPLWITPEAELQPE